LNGRSIIPGWKLGPLPQEDTGGKGENSIKSCELSAPKLLVKICKGSRSIFPSVNKLGLDLGNKYLSCSDKDSTSERTEDTEEAGEPGTLGVELVSDPVGVAEPLLAAALFLILFINSLNCCLSKIVKAWPVFMLLVNSGIKGLIAASAGYK